ncbi:hypothetical protein M9H77_29693 [Catharanthus roseus]|uniref:Uncharacterized protein n=1 Tax=Catharanthus roseus TaxID=4058 RepID=A0ACB9ZW26_CATRO|nr:hypothetical protein M9H77_29693 [Catharanthus roseus]
MASQSLSIITCTILLFLLNSPPSFYQTFAKHGYSSVHHQLHNSHDPKKAASNPKLRRAYIALQAWKRVIYSDPFNFTKNWNGPSVCNYSGIYCAPFPNDTKLQTVAGIDLNFGDIAGFLPDELGLLTDLSLLHLSNNRFCGILPQTLSNLTRLFELDLSSNRFVGPFPSVVLKLPTLQFLDLRYNEFEGPLPSDLFNKNFDAVFVNNNRFSSVIPTNIGVSSATVLVLANNKLAGCLPPSIVNFADTLEELLLINMSLTGCLPPQVGYLYKLRVLDVSYNKVIGPVPYSLAGLSRLEQLNLAHNMFTGRVPAGVCVLPNLANFTFSYNFFCEEEGICMNLTEKGIAYDDRRNCLPEKPQQRSKKECDAVAEHPQECHEYHCSKTNPVFTIAEAPTALASPPSP